MLLVKDCQHATPIKTRVGVQWRRRNPSLIVRSPLSFCGLYSSYRHLQQNNEQLLFEHGAGLTQHQSLAGEGVAPKANFYRNFVQAAPPADLFRTKVHEGQGTCSSDPYERTLPNMPSSPPATTVLSTGVEQAPNAEELDRLPRSWLSLNAWLSGAHPRLPLLVKSQKINAVPVLRDANQLLEEFAEQVLPTLSKNEADTTKVSEWWKKAQDLFTRLGRENLLDKFRLLSRLDEALKQLLAELNQEGEGGRQAGMALEILRRKAIQVHNNLLDEYFFSITHNENYVTAVSPNFIWESFLSTVESHKENIFVKATEAPLVFAWESLMSEEDVRAPPMTGCVALLFALNALQIKQLESSSATEHADKKANVHTEDLSTPSARFNRYTKKVNLQARRTFVRSSLTRIFQEDRSATVQFSKMVYADGLLELYRDISMFEAMQDNSTLLRAEVESAVGPFVSEREVKNLFSSIDSGQNVEARQYLYLTLGLSPNNGRQGQNWETVMKQVRWADNWQTFATNLLMNENFLIASLSFIRNAIAAKGVVQKLFHQSYAEILESIAKARKEREATRVAKLEMLVTQFSSYEMVDQSLRYLLELNFPMEVLEKEARMFDASHVKPFRAPVTSEAIQATLEAIQARHPSWVKSGVLPSTVPPCSNPVDSLRLLTRIFIRLTYVPQAGSAFLARLIRRRIGPVGLLPTQFNVPTEFGMVEQYDNLQYKRYDWQGWYQRMVDIHNRNVSIRCRLDDLKRLDTNGNPFIDLQAERRLRILCGNRVGMSVLKLDSDKYEDQKDNITFGTTKLSEILADSRKAQLGQEYWPTVEVKVRKPCGQSQAHYSLIDYDRIESQSKELYEKYKEAKKRSLFVTPMDMWLPTRGAQVRNKAEISDEEGYSVSSLDASLNGTDE